MPKIVHIGFEVSGNGRGVLIDFRQLSESGRSKAKSPDYRFMNNEIFGFFTGSQQYVVGRDSYHPSNAGGLRWTFHRE